MPLKKRRKAKVPITRKKKGVSIYSFDNWEKMDGRDFRVLKQKAKDYYRTEHDNKSLLPAVWTWMEKNGYTKVDIRAAKAAPSVSAVQQTTSILCRLMLDGCPDYNEAENEYWQAMPGTVGEVEPLSDFIHAKLAIAIEAGKEIKSEEKKPTLPKKSIQDRIKEQSSNMIIEFDDWLDTWLDNPKTFDSKAVEPLDLLNARGLSGTHARKIHSHYKGHLDQLNELIAIGKRRNISEDEKQLKEAYAGIPGKHIKSYRDALENIVSSCEMLINQAKTKRKPRSKKAPSAEKMVAKVKYKETDKDLKLVSINPVDIVGSNALWVYNVKYRKLGLYIAKQDAQVLSVKGTTIVGFDEKLSVQKMLRKPEEQLKGFLGLSVPKRKKAFKDIKSKPSSMTGRINKDTIILRAGK